MKDNKNIDTGNIDINNLAIYGAGFAGKKIAKKIIEYKKQKIIFFVDDDIKKIGKKLFNIKIISLKELLRKENIGKILISIPSLNQEKITEIYKKLLPVTKNISVLPGKEYFKNKNINLEDLIDIKIEEILNRKIFQPSRKFLNKYKNKNIMITGGAGSIGSEICSQLLLLNPKKIFIIDQSEYNLYQLNLKFNSKKIVCKLIDINDSFILSKILKRNKIDYVFHTAAYKHVKFLEANPLIAIKNNTLGTISILEACRNLKINLTIISTDKAVEPKSILGLTKRASEILCLNMLKYKEFNKVNVNVVRFGNVFGSQGSAVETFVNQIKNNQNITLTSYKMKRYFMSIREACNLVIQSSILGYNGKIFVLNMGKQIRIIELIKKLLKLYNKNEKDFIIKEIGIFKGEKISEKLSYSLMKTKTKVKNLFISKEKIIKLNNSKNIIDNLKKLLKKK